MLMDLLNDYFLGLIDIIFQHMAQSIKLMEMLSSRSLVAPNQIHYHMKKLSGRPSQCNPRCRK